MIKNSNNSFQDKYFKILMSMTLLLSLVIYKDFLSGEKFFIFTDVGLDTYNAYLPYYKFIIEGIKNHSIDYWSFRMGIGTSIFSISHLIFDPFNLILMLFPIKYLEYGLGICMIIKLEFISIYAYKYFKSIKLNGILVVLGALIWGFNGYVLLWGQHYMFATAIALFTLIMYGLEQIMQGGDSKNFIIGVFLLAINSPYMMYAVTIYVFVYTFLKNMYIFEFKLSAAIGTCIRVTRYYILAMAMSAVIFIPTCYLILMSPRISSIELSTLSLFQGEFRTLGNIVRFFSNNLMGTKHYFGPQNYYEDMILNSSILIILILPQSFILIKEYKKRIMLIVSGIIILLSTMSLLISYIFNGFSATAGRWSFIIIFSMVAYAIWLLDKMVIENKICIRVLILTCLTLTSCLGVIILRLIQLTPIEVSERDLIFVFSQYILIVALVFIMSFTLYKWINIKKPIWGYMLLAVVIIDIAFNGWICTNYRDVLTKDWVESNQGYYDYTVNVVDKLRQQDNSFYRINKDYNSFLNDSLMQGYKGLSSYNSLNNSGYIEFSEEFDNLYVNKHSNYIGNFDNELRIKSLLGVKYILTHKNNNSLEYLFTDNNINVYYNDSVFPLGFTYDTYINQEEFKKLDKYYKADTIINSVVSNKDYSQLTKSYFQEYVNLEISNMEYNNLNIIKTEEDNIVEYIATNEDPSVIIEMAKQSNNGLILEMFIESNNLSNGQVFYSNNNVFSEENSNIFQVKSGKNKYYIPIEGLNLSNLRIDIGNANEKIRIMDIKIKERTDIKEAIEKKDKFVIETIKDSEIIGSIDTDKIKMLVFTIPYCKGWIIEIDEKIVPTEKVNIGFIGTLVEPGKHIVKLKYIPPGMRLGKTISLFAVLYVITMNIIKILRKRR